MNELQKDARIRDLKFWLQESDFKVIVNQELIAIGKPPKYDPVKLHAERQAWRDELNDLENTND